MSQVTISLAPNGAFILGVPSPEDIHHIELPANADGLRAMRKILLARRRKGNGKISQAGNPTQWQVEQWLKADRLANEEERERKRLEKEMAEDAAHRALFNGIDIGELDL